uniref:Uncharacterized protein n=1 Tax=Ciona savignyi TaxID=51511 RepID=H2ZDV7_CIOSA
MVEEYEETEEKNNDKSDVTNQRVQETTKQTVTDDNTKMVGTDGNESGSIEKMFNIVKNAVGNLLGNGGSEGGHVNATSLVNLTVQESNKSEEEDRIDPKWESPVTLVTNKSEVAPSNIQKIPIVVLVEQGDGREFVSEKEFNPHLYPLGFLGKLSPDHFTANLCWFLELVYRVSVMSCIIQPYQNQTSAADPTLYSYVIHKRVQKPPADPQIVENVTILQKVEPPIENATIKVDKLDQKNGGNSEEKVVEKTEDVKQAPKLSKKLIEIGSKTDDL